MKKIAFVIILIVTTNTITAQYGYGNGNRYGRQQNNIPQPEEKEPEPKTAEELVDGQMPKITEYLELNPFEEAVVKTTLTKYLKKRMELQILQLAPDKMKEEFIKINELQEAELKAGLPEEKYIAFTELQKNRFAKKKRKKKNRKS